MTYLPGPAAGLPSVGSLTGSETTLVSQGGIMRQTTTAAVGIYLRGTGSTGATAATASTTLTPAQVSYENYFKAFAARETRGVFDPTVAPNYLQETTGTYPALGAYQFDKNTLADVSYYLDDGNMSGLPWVDAKFTGLDGIVSKAAFLNSSTIQTKAAHAWYEKKGWPDLVSAGCATYRGQTIAGIQITSAALLGGTSLLGPAAVLNFLTSGGVTNPTDGYGTTLSSYMLGLANYQTPFD